MRTPDEVLQFYSRELHNYSTTVIDPFNKYMENGIIPYRPFLRRLFDYFLFLSYCSDKRFIPDGEKYSPIRILFAKGSLSFYGIYISLSNGLVTEASTLLRSLLEVDITLKLILEKDTDERLELFKNYQTVEQWLNIQSNLELVASGKESKETFDKTFDSKLIVQVEEEYNRIKSNYHPDRPYHWAWKIFSNGDKKINNPSIKKMAEHVGHEIDYIKVYGATSLSAHGSHNLINILSQNGSVSLSPAFNKMIYTDGCLALDYISNILLSTVEYFNFQDPEEITFFNHNFILLAIEEAKNGSNKQNEVISIS